MSISDITYLWQIINNLTDFDLDILQEIINDEIEYRKSQKEE